MFFNMALFTFLLCDNGSDVDLFVFDAGKGRTTDSLTTEGEIALFYFIYFVTCFAILVAFPACFYICKCSRFFWITYSLHKPHLTF